MNLPLWVWDPMREKYIVMPLHMLVQYPDGKWGFDWPVMIGDKHRREVKEFFEEHYHLFEVERRGNYWWRYILKERGTKERNPVANPVARAFTELAQLGKQS